MGDAEIIFLLKNALTTTLTIAIPILGSSLVVGLIISIIQTTTSIQEQTLTFVPKIIVTFLVIIFLAGWIVTTLSDFTINLWSWSVDIVK